MKKNRLGTSDLIVGEIGLGCMSLGTDESKVIPLLHEALDLGINFLDTADIYDNGHNEELIGKAIKGRRSDVIIASKVGNTRVEGQDGLVWNPSKAHIMEAIKESLRRLQTDYIDLYQLHGGTLDDNIDETIEAFAQLKREGLIREYGISSIRPNVIREYVDRSHIVSVMSQYSILDRRPEEEVLPLLTQKGISSIVRGAVASGALADGREDKAQKGYLDISGEDVISLRQQLEPLTQANRSLSQTAIQYVLAHPAVAVLAAGASSSQQLRENVEAASSPALTDDELQMIRSIRAANQYTQHR
ncbi:aryl-alcohol dehydrogenase-like predicted oxidoreductase [Paenibacillus sp. SORGH_AS306]|uniref:aldo/keto reductase n=1 Tax=unclassified Paenibacillus TaxID=185978 RepID=UPI00278788C8|nr:MULTISPECIES: aldo/keto reductase [unclassified Paenibacillus]MDQ1235685.1 aryl-alcohol dehydrogenase-like predicted oxidoreductase [Paenibacillus sp. SORGH_AS_0306]MDR6112734.1 aryl-alcohol dehydrogenase-like predicted oxidoreductase [Paenibacillus sp. SORGH_AS_0338]